MLMLRLFFANVCPPKVIMSSFAKVRMSYSKLQCPVVMGGHDGRRGQDHNESKRI